MSRARTGSLYWCKSGWRARLTIDVDGVAVQRSFDLGTKDKAAARVKLRRLVRENAPVQDTARAPVTVAEYAEAWLERRRALGIAAASYEARYLERIWLPAIGGRALGDVTKADVQTILDDCAMGRLRPQPRREGEEPGRYSRQSISHIRATIVRLFEGAWKDELVAENKPARSEVPDIEEEQKARAVLTDEEIGALVAHPEVDAEIKLLVLLSRTVGGLRAGDLNALDWTAFSPGFSTCTVVRRKTRKKKPQPQTLVVPEPVRAFVRAWWERCGQPLEGPVFPVRRGARAGAAKKAGNMSYAARLRRELTRAGITRHELHHETATTLPVDFHSTRRAYGEALARAGVNEQTAMLLTGHSDSKTHQRYRDRLLARELPAAALPLFSIAHAESLRRKGGKVTKPASFSEREMGLEPTTPSLGSEVADRNQHDLCGFRVWSHAESTPPEPVGGSNADSSCSFDAEDLSWAFATLTAVGGHA